jgi:ABC-type multidrug transport system fused ATPase/permease subunit
MDYYRTIKNILNHNEKIIFFIIILGLIATSIVELFGISLIIPIVYTSISDDFYLKILSFLSNYKIIFSSKQDLLIFVLIVFAALFIIKNFLLALFYWYEGKFIYSVSEGISTKLFKQFLYKDYSKHVRDNSAELSTKINIELKYIQTFFNVFLVLISEIAILIGLSVGLMIFSPGIVLKILPILIISFYLFYKFFNKFLKKIGKERTKHDFLKTKKIHESLGGIIEIITFQKEKYFSDMFDQYVDKLIKIFYKFHFLSKLPRIYFETLIIIIISIVSIVLLSDKENIDSFIAVLAVFVAISLRLFPSLNRIINSINTLKYSYPSVESISKTLREIDIPIITKKKIKSFESIKFNEVQFKYPKNNYKIKFNLTIKFGQKIGILGESGSGKTTLINLILGLYKPNVGKIYLNNKLINNKNLRNLISYVPQSVYIFDGTILENIIFGTNIKKTDNPLLKKSLKYSCCSHFIDKLPRKIFNQAGEGGSKLSQGQRQRIGIARALFDNSPILVMDEVTSSLDNRNAYKIVSQILKIKDRTIIFSTHKPELLKNFDTIIRVKEGKIFFEKNH